MNECLGCQRLENNDEKMVKLVTGQYVCNYCPNWLIECEARSLLKLPLKERRLRLGHIEQARSKESVANLKSVMALVHTKLKDGFD